MLRNKKTFTLIATLFLLISPAVASRYLVSLTPDKFFVSYQGSLITEKEVPLPQETLLLPKLSRLPQEETLLRQAIREKGLVIKDFYTFPRGDTPSLKTKATLTFDKDYLYVYFWAEIPPAYQLRAQKHEVEEGAMWRDDNFEIFLDPFLSRSRYYHFIIDSLGEIYDSRCRERLVPDPRAADPAEKIAQVDMDLSWESKAQIWTEVKEEHWTALVKIPFSSFGIKTAPLGSIWGANFCHTSWKHEELIQWQVTPGGFHQPRKFGAFALGEEEKDVAISFSLPLVGYGKNLLHLNINNQGQKKSGRVVVALSDSKGRRVSEIEKHILIPEGKEKASIPFSIPRGKGKEFQITAGVIAQDFSTSFIKNLYLSEPLELQLELTQIFTTDKEIKGFLRLNLGEESLREIRLKFETIGQDKNYFTELDNLEGNHLKFALNPAILSLGDNQLQVTVVEGERKIGVQSRELFMIKPPFDF